MKVKHAHNFIDLTGKRFGMLVVINEADKNRQGIVCWNCICDCGVEKTIIGSALRWVNQAGYI